MKSAPCDCYTIHSEVVDAVRKKMPDENTFTDIAEAFRLFGDSTRVRILFALSNAEMCVCDISNLLGMTKSAISHQLRLLRQENFVKCRRDGRIMYYSLADGHIIYIFGEYIEHVLNK